MNYQNYSIAFMKACLLLFYNNFQLYLNDYYVQTPRHSHLLLNVFLFVKIFLKKYLHTNYEAFYGERL